MYNVSHGKHEKKRKAVRKKVSKSAWQVPRQAVE